MYKHQRTNGTAHILAVSRLQAFQKNSSFSITLQVGTSDFTSLFSWRQQAALVFVLTSAAPAADRLLLRLLVRASLGWALHPRPLGAPGRARWAGRMRLAGVQAFTRKDATKAGGVKTASQTTIDVSFQQPKGKRPL